MASTRREHEEKENFIKLLQLDIENLTNHKCILQSSYQTVAGLLSKAHLMSASIEEHVTRRLNRLNGDKFAPTIATAAAAAKSIAHGSRVGSPKNSAHLSSGSAESGVAEGTAEPDTEEHNESNNSNLSDDASLDTSQRLLLDHLIQQQVAAADGEYPSDEALIETNIKIQVEKIEFFAPSLSVSVFFSYQFILSLSLKT